MRTSRLKDLAGFGGVVALGVALVAGTGCKSNNNPAPIVNGDAANVAGDPADANNAPVTVGSDGGTYTPSAPQQPGRVLGQRSEAPAQQASGEQYSPAAPQYSQDQSYNQQQPAYQQTDAAYDQAYQQDQAAVDASQPPVYADQAPPPLPV